MTPIERALWPEREAPALLVALSGSKRTPSNVAAADLPAVEAALRALGLEGRRIRIHGRDAGKTIQSLDPGIIEIPGKGAIGVLRANGRSARVLTPSYDSFPIPIADLIRYLSAADRLQLEEETALCVDGWDIPDASRESVTSCLVDERLADQVIGHVWHVSPRRNRNFRRSLLEAGVHWKAAGFAAAFCVELALILAVWAALGQHALRTAPPMALSDGWLLLLAASIPAHMVALWLQGRLAIDVGRIVKRRLLDGALRLDPDVTYREGAGQLLGRVLESETFESSAISGGLAAILGVVEVIAVCGVIAAGALPLPQLLIFLMWLVVLLVLVRAYSKLRHSWTATRTRLTNLLVEHMSGHRTRLVQQSPLHWHDAEDSLLNQYALDSRRFDTLGSALAAIPAGAWLVLGTAVLTPLIAEAHTSQVQLAASIGAVLLGAQALTRLSFGFAQLSGVWIAWRQVRDLFRAATTVPDPGVRPSPPAKGDIVLESRELSYSYKPEFEPVLVDCSLVIHRGDRILLEGPSGGGKSTLAAILAGLRRPSSGSLLAGGYSWTMLGAEEWRRRIAVAPQDHQNHIIAAPLAFNLLLGRAWPPSHEDVQDAIAVATDLGLAPLIGRMPGGIMQMVGETGWQLSQGERSRVFIARALLQDPELVVLDESFASLDPENLLHCVEAVRRRAKALLVVAHP